MSCSKNSIWVVEELGLENQKNSVLGVPFVSDGLYTVPNAQQIEDKSQIVIAELEEIMKSYELLGK